MRKINNFLSTSSLFILHSSVAGYRRFTFVQERLRFRAFWLILGLVLANCVAQSQTSRTLRSGASPTPENDGVRLEAKGTTYVPIDSWVYPALDRMAALGYIKTAVTGLRPWTRQECARLVEEAGEIMATSRPDPVALSFYQVLAKEFAPEIEHIESTSDVRVEEAYVRAGFISGQPLADDYHFAKTVTNDFGRPFGHGGNALAGGSARAVLGPFSVYGRGEYQHAGTLAPESASTLRAIAAIDTSPFAIPERTGSIDRFRFLDSYVSMEFHKNLISFGKQTLWWGPGGDAPFLFSNNAEPMPMLRISRVSPFVLPWLLRFMGPIRFEAMWARPGGQDFAAVLDSAGNQRVFTPPLRPHVYIDGEKLSFQPTQNLEFGFGVTTIFGGPGFPLTLHTLLRTYSISNTVPGAPDDPGDRRSAFDFTYRIPGLRNWLTLYADSFTEDEFSPIAYPRKSAFRPGIYVPKVPKLSHLDLRVEGNYTDLPNRPGTGVAYSNGHYISGYTNFGQIIGSWIGRQGRSVSVWSNYYFNAQSTIQLHFRNQEASPAFLEGGHVRDFEISGTFAKAAGLVFGGTLQYEHWAFPLLSSNPRTDVRAGIELSFRPVQGRQLDKK